MARFISNSDDLPWELTPEEGSWLKSEVQAGRLSAGAMEVYKALRRSPGTAADNWIGKETGLRQYRVKLHRAELSERHIITDGQHETTLHPSSTWVIRAPLGDYRQDPGLTIRHSGLMPEAPAAVQAVHDLLGGDLRQGKLYWALWFETPGTVVTFRDLHISARLGSPSDVPELLVRLKTIGLLRVQESCHLLTVSEPPAECVGAGEASVELSEWLTKTRDHVAPRSIEELAQSEKLAEQRHALWVLYKELQAYSPDARVGTDTIDRDAIKRLLDPRTGHTLESLRPYLVLYMLMYDAPYIKRFGRHMLTFEKNLQDIKTSLAVEVDAGYWNSQLSRRGLTHLCSNDNN